MDAEMRLTNWITKVGMSDERELTLVRFYKTEQFKQVGTTLKTSATLKEIYISKARNEMG